MPKFRGAEVSKRLESLADNCPAKVNSDMTDWRSSLLSFGASGVRHKRGRVGESTVAALLCRGEAKGEALAPMSSEAASTGASGDVSTSGKVAIGDWEFGEEGSPGELKEPSGVGMAAIN